MVGRVLRYVRPHAGALTVVVLLTLASAALNLLTPLIFRELIDVILPNGDVARLDLFALLLVIIPLVATVLNIRARRLNSRIGETIIHNLRMDAYLHLQRMSFAFFTETKVGELVSRVNTDTARAQNGVNESITTLIVSLIEAVAILAVMIALDWRLTLLGVAVVPLFIVLGRRTGNQLRELRRQSFENIAQMRATMHESLNVSGILLTKLFGQTGYEADKMNRLSLAVRDGEVKHTAVSYGFLAMLGLLGVVGTALVYWVGGHLVLDRAFTVGTIVAFAAYLVQLYGPMQAITNAPVMFITALVSFERVFETLDLPVEVGERDDAQTLTQVRGALAFQDVAFRYGGTTGLATVYRVGRMENVKPPPGAPQEPTAVTSNDSQARTWALEDITFEVEPGQLVALVGASGAGKTTLSYLIPRLYDPTSGSVALDGHDLRDLTLPTIAGAVGVVTQETYLFHDTIRANLLYANLNASQTDLERACEMAQLHAFIRALPEGYDTLVGERGYRLSGGEKQRLSLARVILRDPRVLVLDEATSHLDSQSETLIQKALKEVLRGRTSVVIAHRLSTILAADQILVFDRGRIVERGTHQTLLADGGVYANLYETQFGAPSQHA
ncbi:MAG: ABC transporter ATP-binding protein [Anaerolineae bacterium]|nr:ABC transporter ATP-binding protein [Anaerolineae bacterium]